MEWRKSLGCEIEGRWNTSYQLRMEGIGEREREREREKSIEIGGFGYLVISNQSGVRWSGVVCGGNKNSV